MPTMPIQLEFTPWKNSPDNLTLPRATCCNIVGYNELNESIYVLGGGGGTNFQLVRYDMNPNQDKMIYSMHDYGLNYLQQNTAGGNQMFSQLGNVLYMTGYDTLDSRALHRMFLLNNTFDYYYIDIPYPATISGNHVSCLTATSMDHDYIFVIGTGWTNPINLHGDRTQIFDINDHIWISDGDPRMNIWRAKATCAIVDQKVYMIGGWDTEDNKQVALNTIETLDIYDINNLNQYSWESYSASLPEVIGQGQAIVYGSNIIVSGSSSNQLHVINTLSKTIYQIQDLVRTTQFSGVVMTYPYYYAFPFCCTTEFEWQYARLKLSKI